MFLGSSNTTLDSKNRFILPSKFRKYISPDETSKFILNRGISRCIDIYPLSSWKKIEKKLETLDPFNPKDAKFMRVFLFDTNECEVDSQFRILVPQSLLDYANITKEILVVGIADKLELWNPEDYKKYLELPEDEYEQLTKEVMSINI
ncbi:MAG TPA: division/cell wall cluster transcriptional repressor MraZ [Ignavibacteriales bacterium]|jgi:MraZ protein|nr:division/cell wall cluster transcriptional repressor MraZ [Ignavibacteriales bacterium]